jgi:type II secretory pathway component PulJ
MKTIRSSLSTRSSGYALMEVLVAMSISLVVTASMIALMSDSLAQTANIIKMTKLTDDLRISMQMMSRDVRRSNYSANAIHCFANPDCVTDGSLNSPGDVQINESNTCFYFLLDRDHDGDSSENAAGGFRRAVADGIGVIQMWVSETMPDCDSTGAGWVLLTDPNEIEITGFSVDDALSYSEVIFDDGDGNQIFQKVRKLRLSITGRLTSDETIQRSLQDAIKLRNNLYL